MEPLIYTSKGNMPIEDLKYETYWYDTPEVIKFVEIYKYKDEVVRESAHVYVKKGMSLTSEQGDFNG